MQQSLKQPCFNGSSSKVFEKKTEPFQNVIIAVVLYLYNFQMLEEFEWEYWVSSLAALSHSAVTD